MARSREEVNQAGQSSSQQQLYLIRWDHPVQPVRSKKMSDFADYMMQTECPLANHDNDKLDIHHDSSTPTPELTFATLDSVFPDLVPVGEVQSSDAEKSQVNVAVEETIPVVEVQKP